VAVDLSTIQTGMDVLDPTGQKVGTVADILDVEAYKATDSETTYTDTPSGAMSGMQTTTVAPNPSAGQRYLKINQGGILGIVAKELYVPFDAVDDVVPGGNLTIDCTKDTCGDMYGTKPDFLP
jgi:hypothetical protein